MRDKQICARCVMDTTAPGIRFDEQGICNYCSDFLKKWHAYESSTPQRQARLERLLAEVKAAGQGKEYDCIVGVSGGVDSSYTLYLAVKNGLRPLAVHLDNGWNSEIASHNIANLVGNLGAGLHTHVIDWEENRDLQVAFFRAQVLDIELLMDNAMLALNYQQAVQHGLRYILAGTNLSTEGMTMPTGWNHYKFDAYNIRHIVKKFGNRRITTHPLISTTDMLNYRLIKRINWVSFLDYFDYYKENALSILKKECDYKPYPYKHYESVFTRFYQGYILPKKFGIDKRRLHLSNLIVSGQLERSAAMKALEADPYPDPRQRDIDRLFVLKKLGLNEKWFDRYLTASGVPHAVYGSERWMFNGLAGIYRALKSRGQRID